ncbi:MAG: hypothetical protein WBG37_00765 [Desulfobacterales bacterium]
MTPILKAILTAFAVLAIAGSSQAGIGDQIQRLITRFKAPEGGNLQGLTENEIPAFQAIPSELNAVIAWSSNRSGNHEIYTWDTQTGSIRQLTQNEHVDYFANFSPDGKQLVFSRSQRPWVSFREQDAWDVYLMKADGSDQKLLARTGYQPTWATDGRHVTFVRRSQIVQIEVDSQKETILGDAEQAPINGPVHSPVLASGRGKLGLILRQSKYIGPAVLDLPSRNLIKFYPNQACQTFWSDNQQQLLFVAKGGEGGTRIMVTDVPDGGQVDQYRTQVLMDLPGAYSHEYFPRIDNSGNWLVWGAAAQGHEHDRADYEIFLWRIGRPWQEAQRLTHYSGNDQWPDIFVRG